MNIADRRPAREGCVVCRVCPVSSRFARYSYTRTASHAVVAPEYDGLFCGMLINIMLVSGVVVTASHQCGVVVSLPPSHLISQPDHKRAMGPAAWSRGGERGCAVQCASECVDETAEKALHEAAVFFLLRCRT